MGMFLQQRLAPQLKMQMNYIYVFPKGADPDLCDMLAIYGEESGTSKVVQAGGFVVAPEVVEKAERVMRERFDRSPFGCYLVTPEQRECIDKCRAGYGEKWRYRWRDSRTIRVDDWAAFDEYVGYDEDERVF